MNFCVGDCVEWRSQSRGSTKTKTGKIVRVLCQGDVPRKIARTIFPRHKRMFDGWTLPGKSGGQAYLVEVFDGKTAMASPKLYMPYPSNLERIK